MIDEKNLIEQILIDIQNQRFQITVNTDVDPARPNAQGSLEILLGSTLRERHEILYNIRTFYKQKDADTLLRKIYDLGIILHQVPPTNPAMIKPSYPPATRNPAEIFKSALHFAVERRLRSEDEKEFSELVKTLITKDGIPVDTLAENSLSALETAIAQEDEIAVSTLLQLGAKATIWQHAAFPGIHSTLHHACNVHCKNKRILEMLISANPDALNFPGPAGSPYNPPLLTAVNTGNLAAVEVFCAQEGIEFSSRKLPAPYRAIHILDVVALQSPNRNAPKMQEAIKTAITRILERRQTSGQVLVESEIVEEFSDTDAGGAVIRAILEKITVKSKVKPEVRKDDEGKRNAEDLALLAQYEKSKISASQKPEHKQDQDKPSSQQ